MHASFECLLAIDVWLLVVAFACVVACVLNVGCGS